MILKFRILSDNKNYPQRERKTQADILSTCALETLAMKTKATEKPEQITYKR